MEWIALLLWTAMAWWVVCRKGWLSLQPSPWLTYPTGTHVLGIMSLYFASQLMIFHVMSESSYAVPSALMGSLSIIIIATLIVGNPIDWYNPIQNLYLGAAAWLVAFPSVGLLTMIVSSLLSLSPDFVPVDQVAVSELKESLAYPARFIMTCIAIVLLAPLAEEILFRGFLQSWLRSRLGPRAAIFLASLVFTAFHYSPQQGYSNIELLSALFVLSCILGFLYERQRSLWAPIGLHCTFNLLTVLFITLSD